MNTIRLTGDKPVWLDSWPDMATLNFPQSMRMMANRLLNTEHNLLLHVTDKSLTATIGSHRCIWTFLPNGTWKRSCTCRYINDKCVHAFAAYLMLKQACIDMEWPFPAGNISQTQQANTSGMSWQTLPPPAPRQIQPPKATQSGQMSFFSSLNKQSAPQKNSSSYSYSQQRPAYQQLTRQQQQPACQQTTFSLRQRPAPQPTKTPAFQLAQNLGPIPTKLEVELEFFSNPKRMYARFYFVQNGYRTLQDISRVRYAASLIPDGQSTENTTAEHTWSSEDRAFLTWLLPQLRARGINSRPQTFFGLPSADMEIWLNKWGNVPGRFIEKYSQQPFNPLNVTHFSSLHFELTRNGENLNVFPVIMGVDGTRFFVHKLSKAMQEDHSNFVKERLQAFKSPVPWDFLCKYYSCGPVNIQYSDAQRQLPPLINYRFDLIMNSDNVVNIHVKEPKIAVEASADNNNNFQITLVVDGKRIAVADKARQQTANVRFVNGKLFIEAYSNSTLEKMGNLLKNAHENIAASYMNNGTLSFPATQQSAQVLIDFWNNLPNDVEKLHTRRVAGLLTKQKNDTFIDISLKDRGKFADITFSCSSNGYRIPDYAFKDPKNINGIFQTNNGDWMHFDYDKIAAAMQALAEEGFDGRTTTILKQSASGIVSRLENAANIRIADNSMLLLNAIRSEKLPPELSLSKQLNSILRSYQKIGFDFLAERVRYGVGSILADDMGLGKTLQVLSVIEACRQDALSRSESFRALVVAPASVIDVWLKQTAQFCSQMSTVALRGTKATRKKILDSTTADIMVTHYGLVRSDVAELAQHEFSMIILDEAQAIKNPGAAVTSAVRSLKSQRRLALTGTPLENSLGDLWSILDFLNPGVNGELADFQVSFATGAGRSRIARLLKLLMLRRSKALVAPELPQKTEEIIRLDMDDDFEKLYAKELAMAKMSGASADMATILSLYTRLRLLCCAPELVMKDHPEDAPHSIKINFLKEKLQELTDAGHSVLVFSQFTSMLSILERELSNTGISLFKITGDTPISKRSQIVDDFDASETPAVFLLSLKAAGTGLTLTKADYVFLADPWWNPAVENQAIDRTHRIGQNKPVFAYRIIMAGSIEEKVLDIIQYKRELFSEVIDGVDASGSNKALTLNELRNLLTN